MTTAEDAAAAFLGKKRIAVTGVSRNPQGHGSNAVYKRLRSRGYQVFAVNPNAARVEGNPCYPSLRAIPDGVEAVLIGTRPELADAAVQECADLGIRHVWMHRSFGEGSVCDSATRLGRSNGITVIDGGCPLMFDPTADIAHKVLKRIFTWRGKVPRKV